MTKKEIFVAYDVDVVAGWLVSYGGQDSPHDISRRALAGEVGIPRLLKLFRKYKLKTTWFIPRHSIESFREQVEEVVKDEKELGTHGYSHENPVRLSPEQEEEILVKSYKLIKEDQGIPPVGDTAPWWKMSQNTVPLLLKYGCRYDRSMADNDFQPFYAGVGRPSRR